MRDRFTELLGVEYPILQAPMGYIARAQLTSAVSNAGGLCVIETSSGQLDQVRTEIERMRDLTDEPFRVKMAQMLVRDPGIRFVTTSAGTPRRIPHDSTRPGSRSSMSCRHCVRR